MFLCRLHPSSKLDGIRRVEIKMINQERAGRWGEIAPKEREPDFVFVEVGPAIVEQIDKVVLILRNFGEAVIEEEKGKLFGKPTDIFLVKASSEKVKGYVMSVSLPREEIKASTVEIRYGRTGEAMPVVEMVRRGEGAIGLRLKGRDVNLVQQQKVIKEVKKQLLRFLAEEEIQVEVERLFRKWRSSREDRLRIEVPEELTLRKKAKRRCSCCGRPGGEKYGQIFFHPKCPKEVRR